MFYFKLNPKKKGLLIITTTLLPVNNLARGVHSTPQGAHGELAYPAVRRRPRHGEQRNKGTKGGRGFSGPQRGFFKGHKGVFQRSQRV